jgi:hypothetical protein
MKGQVATETLVLAGFIIAFSVPIIFMLYAATNMRTEDVAIEQAGVTTKALVDEANELWVQGNGSARIVLVNFPDRLKNITVEGREIVFTLDTSKGPVDIVAVGFGNMTDGINPLWKSMGSGLHAVNMTNKWDGSGKRIEVSYAG